MKRHGKKRLVGLIDVNRIRRPLGILFLFALLGVNTLWAAKAYAQTVHFNLQMKNATLEQVFDAIRQQSEFEFFYNNDQVNTSKKVTVNVKDATIEEVLGDVLGNQYNYKVEDRYILLSKNEKAEAPAVSAVKQQTNTISGVVKDQTGETLIGVSVLVKGTTIGTVTDLDGQYTLQANVGQTLVYSYIGYKTIEKIVGSASVIDVLLVEDTQALDEVVVVGFGSLKKANLTGSVSSVKMDDVLGSRPVSSAAQALSGAIAGVRVTTGSGQPGSETKLNIRGVGRIQYNTTDGVWQAQNPNPLILVDNVPIEDISMINPNDIETVTALKDAAASAIHGARAAFGVILITTKKGGKEQKAQVNYSNNFTFSSPLELADKASTLQNVQGWLDAGKVSSPFGGGQDLETWKSLLQGYSTNPSQYPLGYTEVNGVRYDLKDYDIYENFLNNSGFQQSHNVSMAGGSAKSTYRISFGYTDEDGIMVTDKDSYTRYNANISASSDITNWLNIQGEAMYSQSRRSTPNGNSNGSYWGKANGAIPSVPDGLTDYVTPGEMLPIVTPANLVKYGDVSQTRYDDLRLVGRAVVTPFAGLKATGEITYYNNRYNYTNYDKVVKMVDPDKWGIAYTSNNISKFTKKNYFKDHLAMNFYATYEKSFNSAHNLSVTGGYNQEYQYYEMLTANNTDMINADLPSLHQSTGTKDADDDYTQYGIRGLYYRVNYDYQGKYLLEANGRYDGSSKFPKDDRFGFFPSFSAGWRVTEEAFMEPVKPIMNNLKVRGSWGNIGNQNIDLYQYYETMGSGNARWATAEGIRYRSLGAPLKVSNSFTWEKVQTLDFGFDAGFLNNRLNAVFDWYESQTLGMLAPGMDLPAVFGASSPNENTADMKTTGWELELTWRDKIGKVSYHIGFNLYDAQTTITRFDDNETKLLNKNNLYQGKKVGEIWGLTVDRYYTENDFEDYATGKLKEGITSLKGQSRHYAGDVLFKDLDGDGVVTKGLGNGQTADESGDYRVIGNSTARYNYGINGGLSWNNFDFSFFLQGVGKRDIWYGQNERTAPYGVYEFSGLYANLLDYWTPENPNAKYPRFYNNSGSYTSYNYDEAKTGYLYSGAFLRIKNITLGYSVPKQVIAKAGIQNLRLFTSIENLHTFKSTPDGMEPDLDKQANTIMQYPFMQMFSFGLNVSF